MNEVFRQEYRVLSTEEKQAVRTIKDRGLDFFNAVTECVPPGREQSLAKTKIEEAVMWATKGVTAPP